MKEMQMGMARPVRPSCVAYLEFRYSNLKQLFKHLNIFEILNI